MEVIKPGCTLNQWVRPQLKPSQSVTPHPSSGPTPVTITVDGTPADPSPPVPPRPWSPADRNSPTATTTTKPGVACDSGDSKLSPKFPPRVQSLGAPVVPPRPQFTKQTSDSTYVPAHLLHMPPKNAEVTPEESGAEESVSKSSNYYIPIISTMDEEGNSLVGSFEQKQEIIRELSSQFTPVQVDLLIQMFKTCLNPQQKQQQQQQNEPSRRISLPSPSGVSSLSVTDPVEQASLLTQQHVGYAKEGQTNPYLCLADIAIKLDRMQSEEASQLRDNGRESAEERVKSKRHGLYFALTDLLDDAAKEEVGKESSYLPEKHGDEDSSDFDVVSSLPSSGFTRRNALRTSTVKGQQHSISEGSKGLTEQDLELMHKKKPSAYQKPVSKLSKQNQRAIHL